MAYVYPAQYPPPSSLGSYRTTRHPPGGVHLRSHQAGSAQPTAEAPHHNKRPSAPSKARPRGPGRLAFMLSDKVEQCLIRFMGYTDVPFDKIALAVEQSNGPKKNWLREWFRDVTGTNNLNSNRLKSVPQLAALRNEVQHAGISVMAQVERHINGGAGDTAPTDTDTFELEPFSGVNLGPIAAPSDKLDVAPRAIQVVEDECPQPGSTVRTHGNDHGGHEASNPNANFVMDTTTATTGEINSEASQPKSPFLARPQRIAFAEDQFIPPPSRSTDTVLQQRASWPSKRPRTGDASDEEDCSTDDYNKRRRLVRAISVTEIAQHLANLWKDPELIWHYARRSSGYAETFMSSRASTFSGPLSFAEVALLEFSNLHTSEYEEWYHTGGAFMDEEVEDMLHAAPLAWTDPPATHILMCAKLLGWDDEYTVTTLKQKIPGDPEEARIWVNRKDRHDVSPLHLATAFGLVGSIDLLVNAKANLRARTGRGASVCQFARHAQSLAAEEANSGLYWRIIHCRTWLRRGQTPRLKPSEVKGLRAKILARLPEIFETMDDHGNSDAGHEYGGSGQSCLPGSSTQRPATHPTVPALDRFAWRHHDGLAQANFDAGVPTRITNSPASLRRAVGPHGSNGSIVGLAIQEPQSHNLRKTATSSNFHRSPSVPSMQQASLTPFSNFGTVTPSPGSRRPVDLPYLQQTVAQSTPNLVSYGGPPIQQPANFHAGLPNDLAFGAAPSGSGYQPPAALTNNTGYGMQMPSQQAFVPGVGPTINNGTRLPDAGFLPLSLAPDTMRCTATNNGQVQQYQTFPGWRQNTHGTAGPVVHGPQPDSALSPDFDGMSATDSMLGDSQQQLWTMPSATPIGASPPSLRTRGLQAYHPAGQPHWRNCP
ncbi:uncharacterized protein LTR77_008443 [Saxophila tyrrhenica]|uniref:Uncharacterized protein n=1 Tax=Saxophila tyrrhenica TaxID=1690608 RepID=A0AAV9P3W2_9PEZI|nr:hypothetical protein LTR77_008443 [Saxophila tyrrhenica]